MMTIHLVVRQLWLLGLLLILTNGEMLQDPSLGYYAFEKATQPNVQPPRVRKPPYLPTNVPCVGIMKQSNLLQPKDSLCGDLNRGYVPMNPFNHNIQNQPYPFELIKNKTLMFLARSLPFLQQDLHNIPKVFRMPATGEPNGIHLRSRRAADPGLSKLESIEIDPPHVGGRRGSRLRQLGRVLQALDSAGSNERQPDDMPPSIGTSDFLIGGNSSTQLITNNHNGTNMDKKSKTSEMTTTSNSTETRQKLCEPNNGILCQVMQLVAAGNSGSSSSSSNSGSGSSSTPLLNTLAQTLNVMNTAQSFSGIAQLLSNSLDTNNQTGSADSMQSSENQNSKPLFSQILQAFNTINQGSSSGGSGLSGGSNGGSGGGGSSAGSTPYNPLGAILDYFSGSGSSYHLPARRKKPLDLDDILNGFSTSGRDNLAAASLPQTTVVEPIQLGQNPPTPCPSIEEYVAPVYARNYQGLWKYVVQIPHEGYFTQTVQKTACVKGKCDYMDGFCKESSRWVSLLVAEVYYPSTKLATVRPSTVRPSSTNRPGNGVPSSASALSGHASHLSNVYAHPISGGFNTFAQPAINSAMNLAALNSYTGPLKYSSYPSLSAGMSPSLIGSFADYNHYDTVFNRRASGPISTTSNYPQKHPKLVSSGSKQSSIASFLSSPSNYHLTSNLLSGYSPQQLQQLWQQYQQVLGSNPTNSAKASFRMGSDSSSSLSNMLNPLFGGSSINSFAGRLFGTGSNNPQASMAATSRSHDVRPRSLDGRSSRLSTMDQTLNGGATYADEDEISTSSPVVEVRNLPNSNVAGSSSTNSAVGSNGSASNSKIQQPDPISSASNNSSNNGDEEECDGYDANGCYVIRVYYDWFLVPGSCKCWKRTNSGSFDTLKRIFIGK